MALTCKEVLVYLNDYIDGETAPELKAEMDAHFQQCRLCRRLLQSCRKTISLLRKAHQLNPDKNMVERLAKYLNQHLSGKS